MKTKAKKIIYRHELTASKHIILKISGISNSAEEQADN